MENEEVREKRKAVAYIRTGSKENDGSAQRQKIVDFCEKENLEIVLVISDIGASGSNTERKGLKELLALLESEANELKVLIVTDLSRLSRNSIDALSIKDVLQTRNINIIAIDSRNISINHLLLARRDDIEERMRENIKFGIKRAKLSGYFLGRAPFGYIKIKRERGKPDMVVDEENSKIVRFLFNYCASNHLDSALYSQLKNKYGVNWTRNHILKILQAPVYAGLIRIDENKLIKGLHEPIVSELDYLQVNKRLEMELGKSKKTQNKKVTRPKR